jgi:replicative DNA helicase
VTSIDVLDDKLWGFQRGQLYLLAGRTSQGKSALAVTIARKAAEQGQRVLYFVLESSARSLMMRMVAQQMKQNTRRLNRGQFDETEWPKIMQAIGEITELPITYIEKTGVGADFIKRAINENPADLVIVDHLGETKEDSASHGQRNRHLEISDTVQKLKEHCVQHDYPLLLLAQLRRPQMFKGKVPPPTLFELKESGDIENKADVVMLIHRPYVYDQENADKYEAYLMIEKNREGETGRIKLEWLPDWMEFRAPPDTKIYHKPKDEKVALAQDVLGATIISKGENYV